MYSLLPLPSPLRRHAQPPASHTRHLNKAQAILQHPLAWDVLTPDERQLILGRFPDTTHVLDAGTPAAKPNLGALLNDNNFRHDCARYAEGIANGWHEEGWLWDAWEAHSRRKAGDFDGVLERELGEEWGVKLGEGGGGEDGEEGGSKGD